MDSARRSDSSASRAAKPPSAAASLRTAFSPSFADDSDSVSSKLASAAGRSRVRFAAPSAFSASAASLASASRSERYRSAAAASRRVSLCPAVSFAGAPSAVSMTPRARPRAAPFAEEGSLVASLRLAASTAGTRP